MQNLLLDLSYHNVFAQNAEISKAFPGVYDFPADLLSHLIYKSNTNVFSSLLNVTLSTSHSAYENKESVSFIVSDTVDSDISLKLNISLLLVQKWTLIKMQLIWGHTATYSFEQNTELFFCKMMEYSFE